MLAASVSIVIRSWASSRLSSLGCGARVGRIRELPENEPFLDEAGRRRRRPQVPHHLPGNRGFRLCHFGRPLSDTGNHDPDQ